MKIKENTFSTSVLKLFFPSIANCRKLKIQKKSKNRLPLMYTIVKSFGLKYNKNKGAYLVCGGPDKNINIFKGTLTGEKSV
jgi:hypothetical protein